VSCARTVTLEVRPASSGGSTAGGASDWVGAGPSGASVGSRTLASSPKDAALKPLTTHDPPSATSSRRMLQPGRPKVQFNCCAAHWWSGRAVFEGIPDPVEAV
jgi:hypothetical protein